MGSIPDAGFSQAPHPLLQRVHHQLKQTRRPNGDITQLFILLLPLPLHRNIEPRSVLDDPVQTKIFCQGDPRTSLEKCIAFCWYYLRTKINVFRKVCIRVKGINWKVKEGEGGACHISSKKPHCRKISQERSLPMHSPASDRKSKIQSCATL